MTRTSCLGGRVILLVVAALAACDDEDAGEHGSAATLGVMLPLTGPIADVGLTAERTTAVALREINDNGGVWEMPLELAIRDTQTEPERAAELGRGLVEDGVEVIMAGVASSVADVVLDEVGPRGAVVLTGLSGQPELSEGRTGTFFRTLPVREDISWGDWWSEQLYAEGHRSQLYVSSEFYSQLARDLEAAFLELCDPDECTTRRIAYPDEPSADELDGLLGDVADAPPDVVEVFGLEEDVIHLLRQLEQADYEGALVINDLFGSVGSEFTALLSADTVGRLRWVDAAPHSAADADDYADQFQSLHGVASSRGRGELCTYDAVLLAALAMEQAGSMRGEAVSEALMRVANPPGTTVGPFAYAEALELLSMGRDIDYDGLFFEDFDNTGESSLRPAPAFYGWNAQGEVVLWQP